MPLDHERGERIDGMEDFYLVSPIDKYANQTELTTDVVVKERFKRDKVVKMPVVAFAMRNAAEYYTSIGVRIGSDVNCFVQEYPISGRLVFLFDTRVNGKEMPYMVRLNLKEEQIKDLTLRGLWTPYRLN
jgi:hypothetical protein